MEPVSPGDTALVYVTAAIADDLSSGIAPTPCAGHKVDTRKGGLRL